jgi:hypothetical protein
METKPCSRCSRPASFSLAFLLSTIGRTPRLQKCTKTITLCNSCLSALTGTLACSPIPDLNNALQQAYTAFTGQPSERSESQNCQATAQKGEGHHPAEAAAVSCRPCLIACNSRKFTSAQNSQQGNTLESEGPDD